MMTTQLMQLPRPWEILMDSGGHFFRHAATLICAKEVGMDEFKKLEYAYPRKTFQPEITADVCSFPVDERGWVDYGKEIGKWQPEFHGFLEGKSYSFGDSLMLDNLKLWMEAYMDEGDNQSEDGFLEPQVFFDRLEKDYGIEFYKGFMDTWTVNKDYTLRCDLQKNGKNQYMLRTSKTEGNATGLFFAARVKKLDNVFRAVKAQYDVYRNYILGLNVKFVPDVIVNVSSDGDLVEIPVEIDKVFLENLNKMTNDNK